MGLPKEIAELIERFDRNLETYKGGQYNEAQLRQDFLNPFFSALGWDMANKAGYAEAYRDVIHEDAIKIGGATKAPDYCFRIGSVKKFFVEAKKPSVKLKDDVSPAFQLRRYAWSAKLPLSILTDFEEFAVYDCRIKPVQTDKASAGRVLYFTYKDYPVKWDELVAIFSREAVLKGSFDKYAESSKLKKGTATVDDAFLTEIEDWRDLLARNIAIRNPDLSQRELNFAVQRTIDRIVFLRICEDRGIEEYGRLQMQLNGTNVYKRLVQLFSHADDRYNSGLFHFQREKDRHEEPDKLTPNISIDDKPLKDIINRLYYPESPYEFSVLSADILGQVYEQFLGKVIRLTAGHQAKVEEKPEVRKAGGVYYTPKYIVDYIVKNTVGVLLGDGNRGSGIGSQGTGGGGQGSGVGDENSDISRLGSLAGGDEFNNRSIPPDEDISEGRNLRVDQPDATGSGISTGQHSGGPQPEIEKGISSSRVDSPGLAGGTGDASVIGKSVGLSVSAGLGQGVGNGAAGGTVDKRSASLPPSPDNRQLTPKQVSRLKILDPACGSGSFLLGAYQYLLDWHLKWYIENDPEKWAKQKNPAIYRVAVVGDQSSGIGDRASGVEVPTAANRPPIPVNWHLTTSEKKRILLNNIYGVDIDSQAVEVTKLSLLLKVLEGENNQTLANQLRMFHERALPDLGDNIKCGNSLIGPDFYLQQTMLDDEDRYYMNVFDWEKEFPNIFPPRPQGEGRGEGGFDVVIGNPPYVRQESLSDFKEYFASHYEAFDGVADLYAYMMERSVKLLREGGRFSFIVSSSFLRTTYGEPLRRTLKKHAAVLRIVDFGGLPVFANAKDTYVCIPLFTKGKQPAQVVVTKIPSLEIHDLNEYVAGNSFKIPHDRLSSEAWSLKSDEEAAVFDKILKAGKPLGEYVKGNINYGIKTGLNEAFIIDSKIRKALIAKDKSSKELIKPLLGGEDIRRYFYSTKDLWLIFTRRGINIGEYPAIKEHLSNWRSELTPKKSSKDKVGRKPGSYKWYEIQDDVSYYQVFDGPKIVYPDIAKGPRFSLDTGGHYLANTAYCIGTDDLYLLGILNSALFWFAIGHISIPFGVRAGQYRYRLIYQYMEKFPIKVIDHDNKSEMAKHDKITALVKQIISFTKKMPEVKTDHEKTALQRQIDAVDQQVDQLVYGLYELTEEEIAICGR